MATRTFVFHLEQVRSAEHQRLFTPGNDIRIVFFAVTKSPEMCVMQTPPQHQMPFPQTPCSGPHCQQMLTQVVESAGAGKCCSHTEGAGHKQSSALHSPYTPSCSLSVFPCGHLIRGIRSFLHSGDPAQSITSQQHWCSQTLGHSHTWKRGKRDTKISLPQHTRLREQFWLQIPTPWKVPSAP